LAILVTSFYILASLERILPGSSLYAYPAS
jgi:hypothetical protein